jgi:hypothetical protein
MDRTMLTRIAARNTAFLLAVAGLCASSGCSGGNQDGKGGNGAGGDGSGILGFGDGSLGSGGPCKGLECQQVSCSGGKQTTVTGTVYDPSGTLPLYNVMVYVPNAPLAPMPHGPSCVCDVSGSPIVSAITDTHGRFVLENVPVGNSIPLVIQVGKWRKQVTLPTVAQCVDNPIADAKVTRLPAKQSEGDMPRIALTTGNADALECLLRKIGIDASEFTPETGKGSVNFFVGEGGTDKYAPTMAGGASFTPAPTFWNSTASLDKYDMVLLSCEGTENPTNKSPQALKAMQAYANAGGRVFASHWHNYWLEFGPPPFPTIATFDHQADLNNITADIDTSFAKGKALSDWLVNVRGSTIAGKIDIKAAQHTVDAANAAVAQRWIYLASKNSVQYLSANTPLGAAKDKQCGRIVLSDIHVSSGDKSAPGSPYPTGCTTTGLSPQEKALVFMLFDLSACLTPDHEPPAPPPLVK